MTARPCSGRTPGTRGAASSCRRTWGTGSRSVPPPCRDGRGACRAANESSCVWVPPPVTPCLSSSSVLASRPLSAGELGFELLERRKPRIDRAFAAEVFGARAHVLRDLDARAVRRAQRLHRALEQQVLAHQLVEHDLVPDESRAIQVFLARARPLPAGRAGRAWLSKAVIVRVHVQRRVAAGSARTRPSGRRRPCRARRSRAGSSARGPRGGRARRPDHGAAGCRPARRRATPASSSKA